MRKIFILFLMTHVLNAQNYSESEVLTQMLHDFMLGASNNDEMVHENFWAEDLIYTSSAGKRFGKAEIMAGFKDKKDLDNVMKTIFTASDIQIQVYDNMAIVAFKMKGQTDEKIQYYLNSGTFLKRKNRWQVVNWQATKMDD